MFSSVTEALIQATTDDRMREAAHQRLVREATRRSPARGAEDLRPRRTPGLWRLVRRPHAYS